jgi:hypothetical protein
LRACLALGLALGFCSCGFFLWLVLGGPAKGFLAAVDVFVVGGLLTTFVLLYRRPADCARPELPSVANLPGRWGWLLLLGMTATLICVLARFILFSVKCPHGNYDAWGIWNMRARFLFRGGSHWADAFLINHVRPDWSHPDYPLLLPNTVARFWYHMGFETTLVPVLVAMLFTFATVGLLLSAVALLRSPSQGLLAGVVLLGTSFFIDLGNCQYADVPLSFFMLAALVLICLHDRFSPGDGRLLVLAGTMTGFAAWTKNEGLLFLLAVGTARPFLSAWMHGWRRSAWEQLAFGAGLLPLAVLLILFKTQLAPPNDLLIGQNVTATLARITDTQRYLMIGAAVGRELRHIGPWALAVLGGYFLLVRRASRSSHVRSAFPLLVLGLMFVGYMVIYLTTPRRLAWHLATSLDRLLMHLWPIALLNYFLLVRTPEEALAREQEGPS